MTHLGDGPCTYQGAGLVASGIEHILERDFEAQDDDQVAMRVTTISVRVSDVTTSRQGDTIATPSRTWTVQQILEDDGHIRRLYVT
nr:hypothetical protein [Halomonas muralis]